MTARGPGAAAAAREPAGGGERRGFRPSRRAFVGMLGAAAAALVVRDRLSGRHVIRNPATGRPIWIGHV